MKVALHATPLAERNAKASAVATRGIVRTYAESAHELHLRRVDFVTINPYFRAAMTGAVRRCVVLFSKSPATRARKPRLQTERSVFQLSLERMARAVLALGNVDLVLAGGQERPVLAPNARMLRQRGRGYAERISSVFEDVRALGYAEIVAVLEDAPMIDGEVLRAAFLAMEKLAFVIGPSPDGAVYLIGARNPVDHIFEGVRWRTQFVCGDLLARARDAALLSPLLFDKIGSHS